MNKNKQFILNLLSQVISFAVNLGIAFFLTPYIVKHVGKEAYGFVGLANNFITYANILFAALNSMASRFITIHIHQNKYEEASEYFSSVVISNVLISAILSIPAIYIVYNLQNVINVSNEILIDVQLLWIFVFLNGLISISTSVFGCATFVKNKLYLSSMRTIEANLLKSFVLFATFYFFTPHVFYIGVASVICTIYSIAVNIYYTRKLLPQMTIKTTYFNWSKIKELLVSGVWNSITQLSSILANGLDLLITNLFVSAAAMGTISLSKTLCTYTLSLFATISGVFSPQFTIAYAKKQTQDLRNQLIFSVKLCGFFAAIPIAFIFVFGKDFFALWLPGENSELLYTLLLLSSMALPFSLSFEPLWHIFTVTNKVKTSSIFLLISSFLSLIGTFVLLFISNDDTIKMYIIVGFSTLISFAKSLVFLPIYGAKCLQLKRFFFYPTLFRVLANILLACFTMLLVRSFFHIANLWELICVFILGATIIVFTSIFTILNKTERENFKTIIFSKILKNRRHST